MERSNQKRILRDDQKRSLEEDEEDWGAWKQTSDRSQMGFCCKKKWQILSKASSFGVQPDTWIGFY